MERRGVVGGGVRKKIPVFAPVTTGQGDVALFLAARLHQNQGTEWSPNVIPGTTVGRIF